MNQNIENIRLKNGEEYPVSPAYFDGTIVPFEADLSSADRMTIVINFLGELIEVDGVKISDQVIPMETLQKYSWGKLNMSVSGEGEGSMELPMMQIFENLQNMLESVSPQFTTFDIRTTPGYGAFLHPIFSLVVATETGTFHDTRGVVTITFPSVGTYLVIQQVFPSVGTVNGELHFGEYHIPEGYLQISRAVEELYPTKWTKDVELSLYANPILYSALDRAYRAAKPIRLHMLSDTQTYGDLEIINGQGIWSGQVFYDSDSNQLRREVVEFTPKEKMYVSTSITSGTFSVEVNAEVYEEKAKGNLTELTFTFDGTDWTLDGNTVTLSDYGITLDGSPAEGDTFRTLQDGDSWQRVHKVICTIPQQQSET